MVSAKALSRSVARIVATLVLSLAQYRTTAADTPDDSSRGREFFREHDFAKAAAAFEANLKANPTDVEAVIYLGRIAFEQNRLDDAARSFERATIIASRNSMAFLWLGRVYGVQARELGPPRGIGISRPLAS